MSCEGNKASWQRILNFSDGTSHRWSKFWIVKLKERLLKADFKLIAYTEKPKQSKIQTNKHCCQENKDWKVYKLFVSLRGLKAENREPWYWSMFKQNSRNEYKQFHRILPGNEPEAAAVLWWLTTVVFLVTPRSAVRSVTEKFTKQQKIT